MKKIPTLTPPTILHRCSFQNGCDLNTPTGPLQDVFPSRKDNCRAENYIHGRNPPALTLMDDEPLVSLAEPGSYYQMEYIVGGGGGHFIIARDWVRGPCFWANDWRRFWEVEIWGAMVFGAVPSHSRKIAPLEPQQKTDWVMYWHHLRGFTEEIERSLFIQCISQTIQTVPENDLQVCKIFYVSSSCITPSETVTFSNLAGSRSCSWSSSSVLSQDWDFE